MPSCRSPVIARLISRRRLERTGVALTWLNQPADPPGAQLVTGGSGGDEDMLRATCLGVVMFPDAPWEELSNPS